MKLRQQIRTKKPGEFISVSPETMPMVRYYARNFRLITSRMNLKTKKRDVELGEFFQHGSATT